MTSPGGDSGRPLRVLHLEDDPRDAELALNVLEEGGFLCEEDRVDTQEAFVLALERGPPLDLILADFMVPGFDAHEALAIARRLRPDLPFILVSGRVGEEVAIDMLHAGATDYVLKQRLARLVPAVERALREKALEQAHRRVVGESRALADRLRDKDLFDEVLEHMPIGVIVVRSPDGFILNVNRQAERLLGPGIREARNIREIVRTQALLDGGARAGPDDLPALRALNKGELVRDTVLEVQHSDGGRSFVSASAAPIRDPGGAVLAVVATYVDVTDLKRAESALQEADRRKNEFLGVLSHELRNPLAPVRNAIEILNRTPAGSDQANRAKAVIERQTSQLARLVDDLLDVTRISRGKIQLRRSRVELPALLRQAVEDHRPIFASRNIALTLRIDIERQWIDADAARIAQVIGNLLNNAAKFTTAHGHVLVTVRRDGASHAAIEVADDGIGMSSEMLGRLFEPFTQADESLHRGFGGLGLGLAIAKSLIEMHDGHVQARSQGRGKGTAITVTLPLLTERAVPLEAPVTAPAAAGRLRLLLVEDNLDAAETLKEVLEMDGHEVAVAHDGHEGLAMARSFRPDAVLCDIGLPGLNGYDVARQIRADPSMSPTLIALTGYTRPEDHREAFKAGFDHHLGKPVHISELEHVLASLTAHPASRRILVVDDNDDLRDNLKELLEGEGWEVREARNGKEAVAAATGFDPAVVLLDYRLPEMNGGEVLRRLGALHASSQVVLMTASSEVRQLAMEHGLRFYVPKPFRGDDLLDTVEHARAEG
jgi:PAS domain S-box-containing protein